MGGTSSHSNFFKASQMPGISMPQQKTSTTPCCKYCCSVVYLLIGALGASIYVLFTPIYKPVTCSVYGGMLDGIQLPLDGALNHLPFEIPFLQPSSNAGTT